MPTVTFRPIDLAGQAAPASLTISLVREDLARGFFTSNTGTIFRPSEEVNVDPAVPGSGEVELTATADISPASVYQVQSPGRRPVHFRVPSEDANATDLIKAYRDEQ